MDTFLFLAWSAQAPYQHLRHQFKGHERRTLNNETNFLKENNSYTISTAGKHCKNFFLSWKHSKWEYMYLSYNDVLVLKMSFNPFTPKSISSDFIDFILANAWWFYSSKEDTLEWKG